MENIVKMEIYVSIAAFTVSLFSIIFSVYTYDKGLKREKQRATLEAFNRLQSEVLDKLNHYSTKEIKLISADNHSEEYKKISELLARFGHFAVGVNCEIYDEEIVRRLAGRYILGVYNKIQPLIDAKRKNNSTEKHYAELENMIIRIKKYYKNN